MMWAPFFHPPRKNLPHPFSLAKDRIYLDTDLKEELTEQTAPVFPIPTGRVESGWWTLLWWLILPLYVRDSLEDKYILAPSKNFLFSLQFGQEENILVTYLKEELTDLFWKLPGYSLFPQAEQKEYGEHVAVG